MDRRVPLLAVTADVVAVVVFAAVGRANHGEAFDLAGLAGTAAPFVAGLAVAWATPYVRADPASLRSGAVALAGAVVIGLLLRLAFLGSLPITFVAVATVSLGVLLLGWRALSMFVASRATHRVP